MPEFRFVVYMPMGANKAAILLSQMPAEVVEAVLAKLDPSLAVRLRAQIQEIRKTPQPPQVLEQTLFELRDLFRSARREATHAKKQEPLADEFIPSSTAGQGVQPRNASLPESSAAPESPAKLPVSDPVAELSQMAPAVLAAALRDERVPTAALVLSCVPIARAGEVLKLMPKEVRRELALSLGQAANRPLELLRTVAQAVVIKGRGLANRAEEMDEDAQVKKLAELLRNLERDDRKEILDSLVAKDPEAAEKVKKLIYLFEDLLRVENRSLQSLLSEVDMKTLALALAGLPKNSSRRCWPTCPHGPARH